MDMNTLGCMFYSNRKLNQTFCIIKNVNNDLGFGNKIYDWQFKKKRTTSADCSSNYLRIEL